MTVESRVISLLKEYFTAKDNVLMAFLFGSAVSHWAAEEAISLGRVSHVPLTGFTSQRYLYIATRQGRDTGSLSARFIDFLVDPEVQRESMPSMNFLGEEEIREG